MSTASATQAVTIYTNSEMMGNIRKIEGKLVEHGRRKYAQYDAAPFVVFVPKGARKARVIQKSYKPFLLLVAGHGHMEPASMFGALEDDGSQMSVYSSFDDGWEMDFNEEFESYLAKNPSVEIIADYRHTSV